MLFLGTGQANLLSYSNRSQDTQSHTLALSIGIQPLEDHVQQIPRPWYCDMQQCHGQTLAQEGQACTQDVPSKRIVEFIAGPVNQLLYDYLQKIVFFQ